MRIVVVQDYLRMGGTERQSLFLCEELLRCGHDAHMLLFRPGGCLWNDMLAKDIPHIVLQDFDSGVCFLAPGLLETVERLRPEVALCMGRTANCYAGFIQHHMPDAKVVSTLRTGKLVFPLHYWSLGRVRAVLVNSNWWRRRMLERGFIPENVKLIHNPLMLRTQPGDRAKWRNVVRSRTGASEDTCVFVDVAALRSGKRHAELLEAFALFAATTRTDWQLWIVGAGRELEKCRLRAVELGLGKRVHFFGQQPHTGPYYAGADAAVSASREDSLPNFLIEAQAMGLPLVAVDCRGVEECCIPGMTGIIIQPGDDAGFAAALEKTASDKALRENVAAVAPAFAQEHFGTARQAALTIEFLESLAV
jgi:glycosyltransferase involved in cell wall biosynthesis